MSKKKKISSLTVNLHFGTWNYSRAMDDIDTSNWESKLPKSIVNACWSPTTDKSE